MLYGYILAALWVGWLAYWLLTASRVKPVARAESWQRQVAYSAPLWVVTWLLIGRGVPGFLTMRFLPATAVVWIVGLLLTATGHGFAIWARRVLGANWSAEVTVKHDHELIRSGPYALVRHPIYTGLTLAFAGTAIALGEWRGILALLIGVASFWYKLGLEERVMVETFGPAYEDYRRETKALIPFVL